MGASAYSVVSFIKSFTALSCTDMYAVKMNERNVIYTAS